MKRVAITGISGHLGNKLLRRLDREEGVESIVGIDCVPPKSESSKLKFYSYDIRDHFGHIFEENGIDSAAHFAFNLVPRHDVEKARAVNIDGTRNFLDACLQASVEWMLFLSSNTAYGAHEDNLVPLLEDCPLRAPSSWTYAWHKVQCEQMFQDFKRDHPEKGLAIARCCPVVGPKGVASGLKEMFTPLVMVRPIGYDTEWQFVHEDDVTEVFVTLMKQRLEGTFNVGGDGAIRYSEVTSEVGRWGLPLPAWLLKAGLVLSWKLHLQSKSSPEGLEFLKYPVVLSNEKVKQVTGYQFRYTSREALQEYISK